MSPQLEIGKLVDRLKMIEERLKKNDFRMARFLLDDLMESFQEISKRLRRWEKLKKEGKI